MTQSLNDIALDLVAPKKGILAADESTPTIAKRLASVDVPNTEDQRRDYREMLFTAGGGAEFISGVILFDETIRQESLDGRRLADILTEQGIHPGIKVDKGAKPLPGAPGETVTEGLDGLRERLAEYAGLGARFAKWRAVITIGDGIPSETCLATNAHALARYAALCQEAGLVPIVEPEVLMDGGHDLARCDEVTRRTLDRTFEQLALQRVALDGILLKPNMVISGSDCPEQADAEAVADATVACFLDTVPAEVPGIVFLSGGQTEEEATAHLSAMNQRHPDLPWQLSFSYGRALQASALAAWAGSRERFPQGQAAFLHRARMNGAARSGSYTAEMEAAGV
ncbi:MAG: fructose-bisphosphate aldolase class I [Planctomycetota bacterium]|jgi:fructose-bisphosphate aldolase class I|nr:fructose-bisphosphate aldolase class I [Planctomycetota bacterium]MDP6764394.1 fructose-bisphosphate aldolase class I [Planctomycetota bacterium]MDP6990209.1 fructose-bisphosphate aldolase class I [Planctomycetota bacterium]